MGRESILNHIGKQVRVTLDDDRTMTGKFLVFDKHMNLVLSDVTEARRETAKMRREGLRAERRLGLVLLRGERVVAFTVLGREGGAAAAANFDKAPREKKAVGKRAREE